MKTSLVTLIVLALFFGMNGQAARVVLMVLGDSTIWAPGYTEEKWRQLKVGMSKDDVQQLLGEPFAKLHRDHGNVSEGWYYTDRADLDGNFQQRRVKLRAGVVFEVVDEIFWD
jgi:outer membrane protein assembly factor BamE (lipoprotein component of BamABCDE complex)